MNIIVFYGRKIDISQVLILLIILKKRYYNFR